MSDLTESTTGEIFEELVKRHEAVLLVLEAKTKVGNENLTYNCCYNGGVARCIGLVNYASIYLSKLMNRAAGGQLKNEDEKDE